MLRMSAIAERARALRAHPMAPALALGMAAFLTQFDMTAVVVALPSIGADLEFSIAGSAWVMDAYSLAFTGALLVAGAIADRHGRRRTVLGGNIAFASASAACGLAGNGLALLMARALQGAAAAFVITGAIASIASGYPVAATRARAFAAMGMLSGVAMALGPTLGGIIAAWLDWRWIFLANIPACLLIAWAVPGLVREDHRTQRRPLDPVGVTLLTLALGIAIVTLLQGRGALMLLAGSASSAAMIVGFVLQQRKLSQPMLDPVVFAQPIMTGLATLLIAVSVGYWSVLVYLPLYLNLALGMAPDRAGFGMLAATLPMLALPPFGSHLVTRYGWRRFFAAGLAIMTVGNIMLAIAFLTDEGAVRLGVALLGMLSIGTGAALAHPQLSGAVVALVPADQAGMASAATIVLRQGGFCLGIAAFGALLENTAAAEGFVRLLLLAAICSAIGAVAASAFLPKMSRSSDRDSVSR